MRYHLSDIPDDIIQRYNLKSLADEKGFVYAELRKAMFGLPEAGKLAWLDLQKLLEKEDYYPSKYTPGLWLHKHRDISFTLVVDDFGVKYTNKADADHLISVLKTAYPAITEDWTGRRYVGVTLDWDYNKHELITSMPGYCKKALLQFGHTKPRKHYGAPSDYIPPRYGRKVQMTQVDRTRKMTKEETKRLQQITGKFLYFARAIDDTMLHQLNVLSTQIAANQEHTMKIHV